MPRPIGENTLFSSDHLILCGQISSVYIELWVITDLLWAGYKQV